MVLGMGMGIGFFFRGIIDLVLAGDNMYHVVTGDIMALRWSFLYLYIHVQNQTFVLYY